MDRIDLRSDTVSHPTPRMRHAMMEALVGDDVYGEDPTVIELETKAARRFGKEAGLFVPSGTMGNLVSILAHCGRGDRAIMGDKSHTNFYEAGNSAVFGGVQPWCVPVQPDGTLRLEDIQNGISTSDYHFAPTRLVSIENTQGGMGGQPLAADYMAQVADICHANNLKLHVDGARIFNAAAALQTDVAALTAPADSVTFCLSKGLCAPVGSVVVGSQEFIDKARRIRKALGGGMRQAGMLAAAGIVALEEMTDRLHEDHANAQRLAEGFADIKWLDLDPARVKTNMVMFKLHPDAPISANTLADKLLEDNIWLRPAGPYNFRAVTHYWIKPQHVELVVNRVKRYLA